jgi:hypothetical protein
VPQSISDLQLRSFKFVGDFFLLLYQHATTAQRTDGAPFGRTQGVQTITVPWAERRSHLTLLFERLAIAWLKEATPLTVARRLGLMGVEANGIVERAVRRGVARRTSVAGRRPGIDEHSYLKNACPLRWPMARRAKPISSTL